MIAPLADGYRAEVDGIDAKAWYDIAAAFPDVNLYQMWQDGAAPGNSTNVSRMLIKRNGEIVAGAEVRLFRVPFTRRGIAYIRWGPLWGAHARGAEPEIFRQSLRAMRNEYVIRRGMILRIAPRLFTSDDPNIVNILNEEGFTPLGGRDAERSLILDLSPTLEELRKGFEKKWRNCLSKAERGSLVIVVGSGLDLFREFMGIYEEMLRRKSFSPTADIHKHLKMQGRLPDPLKMTVVLAREHGRPCAGAVVSTIGDTALYLFGATNEIGLQNCGSYLVQWEILRLLKSRGVPEYDLHGVNPAVNPGTYRFKVGLAGQHGREVTFLSTAQMFRWSWHNNALIWLDGWRQRLHDRRVVRRPVAGRITIAQSNGCPGR